MKIVVAVLCVSLGIVPIASAQAPSLVWSEPSPGPGSNYVGAVAWSPVDDALAVGSSDRWFRLRIASTGDLLYSVLEPKNSGGVGDIVFSDDGLLVLVRNASSGLSYRVQRMEDGLFLGKVLATVQANGVVTFAPDDMLVATTGGSLAGFDFSQAVAIQVTGSGYQKVFTDFNFSPDGRLQSAETDGVITVRRTSDGSIVKVLSGESPVEFSHDSKLLAARDAQATNEIIVWKTRDWTELLDLVSPQALDNVGSLRFTPDDKKLAAAGYSPFLVQGLWDQKGIIQFWSLTTGTLLADFDQLTDIAVTSPVTFTPDGAEFAFGLYDGTVSVAVSP